MLIFISGSSKSGKSSYAESKLESLSGSVKVYIAASKVTDDEMKERVRLHQERRKDKGFVTVECECDLDRVNIPEGADVMIESLTAWTANEMFRDGSINDSAYVIEKIHSGLETLRRKAMNLIVVADDIFSDGITYDALTERYMKTLAELEIMIASYADEVIEIFSGMPYNYVKD